MVVDISGKAENVKNVFNSIAADYVGYFKYIKVMDEKEATDEGRYLVLATNKK